MILSATHMRNRIANFFDNSVPRAIKNILPKELKTFFSLGSRVITAPISIPVNFIRKFSNPAVLRFYANFINNAINENVPAATSNLRKLGKELEKSDKKNQE